MEVVINRCYGGFSLSPEALIAYARRKGYENVYFYDRNYNDPENIGYSKSDKNEYFDYAVTEDLGEFVPIKRKDELLKHLIPEFEINRNDSDLVAVVKELGEAANGTYSSLKVVEIPDDVEWEIQDYDGDEVIHEKHRVWC